MITQTTPEDPPPRELDERGEVDGESSDEARAARRKPRREPEPEPPATPLPPPESSVDDATSVGTGEPTPVVR